MEFDRYAKELDDLITDVRGAELERQWSAQPGHDPASSEFLRLGFRIFPIPAAFQRGIASFFDESHLGIFDTEDCSPDAWPARVTLAEGARLNTTHLYFDPPGQEARDALKSYLDTLAPELEEELASPFGVFNVRSVAALSADSFGPTSWHFDGSARFLRKILIYPRKMDAEHGSIELYDRGGEKHVVSSDRPVALLCDTSILLHRGRPGLPSHGPRPMLEVTIEPSETIETELQFRGQNARSPRIDVDALPKGRKALYSKLREMVEQGTFRAGKPKKTKTKRFHKFLRRNFPWLPDFERHEPVPGNAAGKVNIGGGPSFHYQGWINFDSVDLGAVGAHIEFGPDTILPIAGRSVGLVYSSHCLEHLDDATVARILQESRRIIADDGALVLKIPDFDRVLECYRDGDSSFFERQWNIESITPTWPSKGIEDSIGARASFIFAGYWNHAFGNPFAAAENRPADAFHGPAPISNADQDAVLALGDPRAISEALNRLIIDQTDFAGYNHQNAWSRKQFAELVAAHGFVVQLASDHEIRKRFNTIPGIDQMHRISQYLYAVPA